MKHIWHATRKTAIFLAGCIVILCGIVLSLPGIPGPGIVVILIGLAILATEFAWAHHWKRRLENYAKRALNSVTRQKS